MTTAPSPTLPNASAVARPAWWRHAFAVLLAVMTFPLLLSGGSVTVYKVGMAVPDWPTTYGFNMFTYNMLNSPFGVQLEHSHRLIGSALGIVAIVTLAAFVAFEPRRWVKLAAFAAFVGILLQGILGGVRVLENSALLAFVHGCTASLVFGGLVAFAVVTGRVWAETPAGASDDTTHLRRRAAVTLVMVFIQLFLGAWVRHDPDWRAVVVHVVAAIGVWAHALAVGIRVLKGAARWPELKPSALGMIVFASLQLLLGTLAWWMLRPFDGEIRSVWPAQAAVRLTHHGLGALLLAATVVLTVRVFRRFRSVPTSDNRPPVADPASLAPLEAVR
jgi:cytochrome c oxidase assembly protein subunit 15